MILYTHKDARNAKLYAEQQVALADEVRKALSRAEMDLEEAVGDLSKTVKELDDAKVSSLIKFLFSLLTFKIGGIGTNKSSDRNEKGGSCGSQIDIVKFTCIRVSLCKTWQIGKFWKKSCEV